jgi:hypothetical protein
MKIGQALGQFVREVDTDLRQECFSRVALPDVVSADGLHTLTAAG